MPPPPTPLTRRLRGLVAYGSDADTALLGRLGPTCALFADTKGYRARTNDRLLDADESPFGLSAAEAFAFYTDYLDATNKVYPIANLAAAVANHLDQALPAATVAAVPPQTYLLMAAVEIGLTSVADDLLHFWTHEPERAKAKEAEMAHPVSTCRQITAAYGLAADAITAQNDSSLAAFLFGRSAEVGHHCLSMLQVPCFARNITVADLDLAMRVIAAETKRMSTQVSYLPAAVPRRLLHPEANEPDTVRTGVSISDDAKALVEVVANRNAPTAQAWFTALTEEQQQILDIVGATQGDIEVGLRHKRLRYVVECAVPAGAFAAALAEHDTTFDVDAALAAARRASADVEARLPAAAQRPQPQPQYGEDDDPDDKVPPGRP